ncbi:MAG: O-antigen ligase family protein [Planctomycetota bacterium]|jgi:O-antigen ligase
MQVLGKMGTRERIFFLGFFLSMMTVTPYSVMDPINLPKMTVLGVMSFTLLGACLNRQTLSQLRSQKLPLTLVGLFIFQGLLVLTLSGRNLDEGLYGVSGRNTGFLTYLSFSIVLFVASLLVSNEFIKSYIFVLIITGSLLLIYGVIQHIGLEPFPYINAYENNVFGTFGNPNFQSAFMGIFGSLLFALALNQENSLRARLAFSLMTCATVFGVFITNSWQGFFNFAAGAGIALILNFYRLRKNAIASVFLAFGVSLGTLVFMGLLNQGPLSTLLQKASLSARRFYWEAGTRMLLDHPLFGVGWDGFGDWFRRARTPEAINYNAGLIADSAHSIPIDVASSGGIPLIFLYFAFIVLAVLSVIKVVKSQGKMSVNFIALVAAWVSYQAQSVISINQIGLGVIGWSLTGLIIGYGYFINSDSKDSDGKPLKPNPKTTQQKFSFTAYFAPLAGLIIGCLIFLPPFVSANKFYEGIKTSDARVINANAYLKPLELRRMLYAASLLENNKFYKESHEIGLTTVENFPDSYEAWTFFLKLTNSTEADKSRANSEINRLDPSRKL